METNFGRGVLGVVAKLGGKLAEVGGYEFVVGSGGRSVGKRIAPLTVGADASQAHASVGGFQGHGAPGKAEQRQLAR